MPRMSKRARRALLEELCRELGAAYYIDGTCETDWSCPFMRVDDHHDIEILGYTDHVADGTNVVQVNLWYVPSFKRVGGEYMIANVRQVPNDPATIRQVASRLISLIPVLEDRYSAIDCTYAQLDETLASIGLE